jgi:hypothetical protein
MVDSELPTRMGGDIRCCVCGILIGSGLGYFKRKFRERSYICCGDPICSNKLEQEIRKVKGTVEWPKLDYY